MNCYCFDWTLGFCFLGMNMQQNRKINYSWKWILYKRILWAVFLFNYCWLLFTLLKNLYWNQAFNISNKSIASVRKSHILSLYITKKKHIRCWVWRSDDGNGDGWFGRWRGFSKMHPFLLYIWISNALHFGSWWLFSLNSFSFYFNFFC